MSDGAFLEISGFEIAGPNQRLTLSGAQANRLTGEYKIYNGTAIAIWSGHHLLLANNLVHDCSSSGIRANSGDYVSITQNQVYNNTWFTSSASSAIVIATAKSYDERTAIKMRVTNNVVYDNYNQLPFYLTDAQAAKMGGKFDEPCVPTGTRTYGCASDDYIMDG